jgi:hypothetical protein
MTINKKLLVLLIGIGVTNSSVSQSPQNAEVIVRCDNNRIVAVEIVVTKPGRYVSYISNSDCSKKDV